MMHQQSGIPDGLEAKDLDDDGLTAEEWAEVEREYREFWADIVETDGKLDPQKVKLELADFSKMIKEVPIVYSTLTGSIVSKPLTPASIVIELAEEHFRKFYDGEGE